MHTTVKRCIQSIHRFHSRVPIILSRKYSSFLNVLEELNTSAKHNDSDTLSTEHKFSKQYISEMNKLIASMPTIVDKEMKKKHRIDYTKLDVFAIDSANTLRVDDGLSIDDRYVYVHIANPASIIPHNSFIFADACTRYDNRLMLFHPDLTQEISLRPSLANHVPCKLVITVKLPYDNKTMTLKDFKQGSVSLGYISMNNLFNITHEHADQLAHDHKDHELSKLHTLARHYERVMRQDATQSHHTVEVLMEGANSFLWNFMKAIGYTNPYFISTSPLRNFAQFKMQIALVHYLQEKKKLNTATNLRVQYTKQREQNQGIRIVPSKK
jgi:hypothetical protein